MPVKIEDLTPGYWWFQRGADAPLVIVEVELVPGTLPTIQTFSGYRHDNLEPLLPHLIAPVAPYREKNTLVVMGWLGNKSAYLNIPREEAIARFNKDNEDDDEPDDIKEFEFTDELWVYDASGPYD